MSKAEVNYCSLTNDYYQDSSEAQVLEVSQALHLCLFIDFSRSCPSNNPYLTLKEGNLYRNGVMSFFPEGNLYRKGVMSLKRSQNLPRLFQGNNMDGRAIERKAFEQKAIERKANARI